MGWYAARRDGAVGGWVDGWAAATAVTVPVRWDAEKGFSVVRVGGWMNERVSG